MTGFGLPGQSAKISFTAWKTVLRPLLAKLTSPVGESNTPENSDFLMLRVSHARSSMLSLVDM